MNELKTPSDDILKRMGCILVKNTLKITLLCCIKPEQIFRCNGQWYESSYTGSYFWKIDKQNRKSVSRLYLESNPKLKVVTVDYDLLDV